LSILKNDKVGFVRREPFVAAMRGKHLGFATYRISAKELNELFFPMHRLASL